MKPVHTGLVFLETFLCLEGHLFTYVFVKFNSVQRQTSKQVRFLDIPLKQIPLTEMELSLLALTVLFIKGQLSAERWTPGCLVCRHFRIWDVQFLDFYCNLPNCNLIRLYVHYELILYFKVDLMTCPTSAILLLPALVLHQKTCSSCFVNIARIFQMASYLHTVNIRTFGFRHF